MYYMLTSIISRSDSQLLGNKMSFCTMFHAYLFNSNKFHKFWMSCAYRRSQPKSGWKRRKSRPLGLDHVGRSYTSTYMGAFLFQKKRDMLTMPLNQGLAPDSVGGPGRHRHQPKGLTSRCLDEQTSVIPNQGAISCLDLQHRWNGGLTSCPA